MDAVKEGRQKMLGIKNILQGLLSVYLYIHVTDTSRQTTVP